MSWLEATGYMGFKESFVVPNSVSNIPRFGMLVCGMFCSIAISSIYSYSLITNKFTADYHFTQNDITTISTVGIVIGYLTFPFGIIYDYIGPKPIFALGIIFTWLGTMLFALTFDGKVGHSVGGLAIINAILNLGSAMFDMGSVLTVLSWFPLDRGLVVGCMKTMTGLGSSFVSTLYGTYFNGDNVPYMFFLMAWSIFIGLVAIVVFYLPPYHITGRRKKIYTPSDLARVEKYQVLYMNHKAPVKRFAIAFALVIAMFIVIFTRSIVFVFFESPTMSQKNPPTIIMIVLYVLFLCVLLPWKWLDVQPSWYNKDSQIQAAAAAAEEDAEEVMAEAMGAQKRVAAAPHGEYPVEGGEVSPVNAEPCHAPELKEEAIEEERPPRTCWQSFTDAFRSEEVVVPPEPTTRAEVAQALHRIIDLEKISPQFPTGFLYNIRRPTLLCMWVTGFCISGAVNVILMNSSQIYFAVSGDPDDKVRPALYVALTGLGSALGRLVMAFTEVFTQSAPAERRIPITVFYCVPPIMCVLSCVLFLVVPTAGLIAPMLLGGLGNGFYAACEVLTVRSIFSVDVAKHYNSLFFFEMLAVIFMNRLLFGEIMTRNSSVTVDGAPQCVGRKKCIQTTFIVLTALSALGVLCSLVINITYVRFARGVYAQRRQERERFERMLESMDNEQATPEEEPAADFE